MSEKVNKGHILDIIKTEDGRYINKLNGKVFGSASGIARELLNKYNMTPPSYLIKFGYVNKEDYPLCSICNNYVSYLRKHVSDIHNYTKESYVEQFGEPEKWVADTLLNTIKTNSTNNNGNSKANTTEQQRKERSPMAIEFYQRKFPELSNEEHLQMLNEAKNHISGSIKNHTTRLEYWLKKTDGDDWTAADIWRRDALKKDITKNALPGVKYLQLWESVYRGDKEKCLYKITQLLNSYKASV
jgi:hypothetical protein